MRNKSSNMNYLNTKDKFLINWLYYKKNYIYIYISLVQFLYLYLLYIHTINIFIYKRNKLNNTDVDCFISLWKLKKNVFISYVYLLIQLTILRFHNEPMKVGVNAISSTCNFSPYLSGVFSHNKKLVSARSCCHSLRMDFNLSSALAISVSLSA